MEYITLYPCGSAVGTIRDLAKYAKALMNEDAPLFQNKSTQEKMYSGSNFYGNSDVPYCSYGFWIGNYDNATTFMHNGSTGWHSSDMEFDLDTKYGYVCFSACAEGYLPISELLFGGISLENNPAIDDKILDMDGYYKNTRTFAKGILKTASVLYETGALKDSTSGKEFGIEPVEEGVRHIGDNMYMIYDTEHGDIFAVVSPKSYSDGKTGINMGSTELIRDNFYMLKIVLFTLYLLVACASWFTLMIKLKLKKIHKLSSGAGTIITSSGQVASIISVVALIIPLALIHSDETFIIPTGAMVAMGIIQMICIVIVAASVIVSICSLIGRKNSKFRLASTIACIIGNVITTSAILYFEMYRFWGC